MDDDKPKLLDQVRQQIRVRNYSIRTETAYAERVKRYIRFHQYRHPLEMGAPEIKAFLTHLAVKQNVAGATQNQALAALLFLYKEVLKVELPWLDGIVRAKKPKHLPVVLMRDEVTRVLAQLSGVKWMVATLLYGSGLRLLEALRLRVKDVEFSRGEIVVRDGKGQKDRVTMLPRTLVVRRSICRRLPICTSRIWLKDSGGPICRLLWRASIRMRRLTGLGSLCFRRATALLIPVQRGGAASRA